MNPLTGIIAMWSGSIAAIPAGWTLCDGTLGAPDLRDKFVIGAGAAWNPLDTGGNPAHTHTFNGLNHNHDMASSGYGLQAGGSVDDTTKNAIATGTNVQSSHYPPYMALCYIMKL